jgi:hypothetical protein
MCSPGVRWLACEAEVIERVFGLGSRGIDSPIMFSFFNSLWLMFPSVPGDSNTDMKPRRFGSASNYPQPTCYSVSPTKHSALPTFHHLRLPHHGNHVRNLEPWHRHWYNVHSPEPTILVELPSLRPPVQVADQLLRVCEVKTPLQESARDAATLIIGMDGNAPEICKV